MDDLCNADKPSDNLQTRGISTGNSVDMETFRVEPCEETMGDALVDVES
jgi:hypothetical protein